ncbi:replication endonuclease [Methylovulum psychrotolerans]|uniref:Replication gene A protein-like domain-containing protein n=1 Tax=Methylovulum psychrotolerans TaxID=1704499 RepID=A0A2S5CR73_9GAMM|nr:replication endonuclease [Methylovulum psychrotolerans]POZ53305.1 hypothetical protein AADEFJLK_00324 [Methylovulum psychrotolerans]
MKRAQAKRVAAAYIKELQPLIHEPVLVHFFLLEKGIEPPKASNDESFNARLLSLDWWIRKIISKAIKDREAVAILNGMVSRGRQVYCSDTNVNYVKAKQLENLIIMDSKLCVSDEGDEIPMLKILQSSMANPENRRAELMVRMAGFEQYADSIGHVGMFYTITCPSKYHRFSGNALNENYSCTPRQGQDYLTTIWARIRAEFNREGFHPYGFRVAEPHQDGTPHWHMLLFMPRDHAAKITDIIRDYALREDGEEQGAQQHRFTVKEIVKEIMTKDGIKKVSATGYIAKYIAKNIGFDIGLDSEEDTASTSDVGDRVRSWASVWGIRQFQQIGGASVTVWRELRRLKDQEIEDPQIRAARDFCVANDWASFLDLMGGIDIKRLDRAIQLLKKNEIDTETGEIKMNRYGEVIEKIIGIATLITEMVTHTKKWVLVNKPSMEATRAPGAGRSPWSPINNCTEKLE